MGSDPVQLSKRERQIMEAIYARGSASALEVAAALPDPPSHTAVRTLLRILERKGHLSHTKRGREFFYKPTRPHGQAARSAMRTLLATFFGNSLERAVAAYMADPAARVSDEEIRRIEELLAQGRRHKGRT